MEKRTNSGGGSFWVAPDGSPRGVRRGEKGTKIVFSKTVIKTETDPVTGVRAGRPVYLMHMWSVFNADQAEQLPARYYPAREGGEPVAGIRDAQEVLDKYLANGGPNPHPRPLPRAPDQTRASPDHTPPTDIVLYP